MKGFDMIRNEMIFLLTKYEMQFLIDNPDCLEATIEFFANGGFNKLSDQELIEECNENCWLE
jgi:hypothetical protein